MTSPTPGPSVVAHEATAGDLPTAHPEVSAALDALAHDLPTLPLPDHHDRCVVVLELLHGVLDGARAR